ncbi:hypothetical protein [Bathymodiolus platifrons methanotrophic gill symbiont]|nr:hypothetical protein [Bathymodiolus platifrons methanotrophic gill symbiont]
MARLEELQRAFLPLILFLGYHLLGVGDIPPLSEVIGAAAACG